MQYFTINATCLGNGDGRYRVDDVYVGVGPHTRVLTTRSKLRLARRLPVTVVSILNGTAGGWAFPLRITPVEDHKADREFGPR